MEMNVYEDQKQVNIWLTKAEKNDQELREKLKPIYAKYHDRNYLVAVFESGEGDLRESVLGLLRANQKRMAQQEVRKSGKSVSMER